MQVGRLAAKVNPKFIRLSDNRVDLVFEIFEGGLVEIERISFVETEPILIGNCGASWKPSKPACCGHSFGETPL